MTICLLAFETKDQNIFNFAVENPGFVGCEHPLLKRFCPASKCFIKEFIDEYEKPKLFNNI